jgi:diaminohydroxyphosphoribosylaminopyrimidine deaminase / 5-amino-6-(5-phosphoribosylamino)uracil reductase
MTTGVAGGTITVRAGGLWSADVDVAVDAAALLDLYLPLAARTDLVIGQIGQSLDGRVATESGHSHYVTGEEDIVRLHRVRALVDAVLIGAGTAVADDPRLTVRHVEGPHPARVILDPNGRVDPGGALFTDDVAPTLWIRRGPAPTRLAAHVEVVEPPPAVEPDGALAPAALIGLMRTRGWRRILVEGGGVTVSNFLEAGAFDRLHVTVAPLLIGAGRHGITLPPVPSLDQALRPRCRHFALGADVLFDLELRPSPVAPDGT